MASRAADRITVPGGLDNPSDFILVALQVHWVCPLKVVSLEYGFKPDGGLKMPRKRHKAEEIVAKLRQVDVLVSQGQNIADAIRQIGVSEVTY